MLPSSPPLNLLLRLSRKVHNYTSLGNFIFQILLFHLCSVFFLFFQGKTFQLQMVLTPVHSWVTCGWFSNYGLPTTGNTYVCICIYICVSINHCLLIDAWTATVMCVYSKNITLQLGGAKSHRLGLQWIYFTVEVYLCLWCSFSGSIHRHKHPSAVQQWSNCDHEGIKRESHQTAVK